MGFMAALPWLVPSAISALGMLFGGGSGGTKMDPAQQALLNTSLRNQNNRMLLQNPLYEEATTLARALMPRSARPSQYILTGLERGSPVPYGGRTPSPDAEFIGQAVRRGTYGTDPTMPTSASSAATAQAISALANGVQSPLLAYRDRMMRDRSAR